MTIAVDLGRKATKPTNQSFSNVRMKKNVVLISQQNVDSKTVLYGLCRDKTC